jgi:hypothetical protein
MKKLSQWFLVACLTVTLTGCDQFRARVAGWIAPQSPAEALKSVDVLLEQGQLKEAKNKVEAHINESDEWKPHFELAAARIHALQGDQDIALQFLSKALSRLDISPDEVMTDRAFVNLRTDVRFLQIITGQYQDAPARGNKTVRAGDDAQIQTTKQGTEIRAGDVVIKLPN